MKTNKSLIALAVAAGVNAAALAALDHAMTAGAARARLAQVEAPRLLIVAKKPHTEQAAAARPARGSRS